jgi:hypothetical protein
VSTVGGQRQSKEESELSERYEFLIQAASGSVGSAPTEAAKTRLIALLARDLTYAIASFQCYDDKVKHDTRLVDGRARTLCPVPSLADHKAGCWEVRFGTRRKTLYSQYIAEVS